MRQGESPAPTSTVFSEFLQDVDANRVAEVTVTPDVLTYVRRDGKRLETVAPPGYVASNPTFVSDLTKRGVRLDVRRAESSNAGSYGAAAIGVLFLAFTGFALFRLTNGRVPTLEKARTVDPQQVTVTFADVAGVDEAKEEVSEI